MKNVYDTTDPQKLLDLKRLEAEALLDVLRTVNNAELKIPQLCMVARNVLKAQLGVRRLAFYYEWEDGWHEGTRSGFESLSEDATEEMLELRVITPVSEETLPALADQGIEYVVPIINRKEASAFFLIADFADSEIEAQNDLIFIATLGNILVVAIQNRLLFQQKMSQEFLRKELEVAETIQRNLLISDFTRFKEIDIFAMNQPHHGVGGDFYDIIKKGKGQTFLCIADVSGKGIGAALLMANLQANLRALCAQYEELTEIIFELNRLLHQVTEGEKFVTLFLARVDSHARTLTYVNAGHNPPIFLTDQKARRLESGCLLLGIMDPITIEEEAFSFIPGDRLFTFTDGVVEQTNQVEDMLGSDRVISALRNIPEFSAEESVEQINILLNAFAEGVEATDDITMLSVKFS